MERSRKKWSYEELDFLEHCVYLSIPRKHVLRYIGRSDEGVTIRVKIDKILNTREDYKNDKKQELRNRYLTHSAVRTKHNGTHLEWTRELDAFVRKCAYINIPYEDIAKELGVHKTTIVKRARKLQLSKIKGRFHKKFCSFYSKFIGVR